MTTLMRLHTTIRHALALGPLAGLSIVIAACGSAVGGYGASSSPAGTQVGGSGYGNRPAAAAAAATVSVNEAGNKRGALLTDGQGRTLYLFEKDQAGTSACSAACLAVWPALTTTGGVQAGPGLPTSMLSTIHRPDGSTEVAYNGHPLYHYVGDGKPGDTNGQGLNQFGAGWYVVSPNGSKIDNG
jgi:predicted lipoprotein with Yx(FWY)xxD motif